MKKTVKKNIHVYIISIIYNIGNNMYKNRPYTIFCTCSCTFTKTDKKTRFFPYLEKKNLLKYFGKTQKIF